MDRLPYLNCFTDARGRPRTVFRKKGLRTVTLPGHPGEPEFQKTYEEALAGLLPKRRRLNRQRPSPSELEVWAKRAISRLIYRAAARKVSLEIKAADLVALVSRADGRCMVTGMPLIFSERGNGRPISAYAASIDRIDNRQGYVRGNVRLVCYAMNVAFNHWGEDVFAVLAKAFLEGRQ